MPIIEDVFERLFTENSFRLFSFMEKNKIKKLRGCIFRFNGERVSMYRDCKLVCTRKIEKAVRSKLRKIMGKKIYLLNQEFSSVNEGILHLLSQDSDERNLYRFANKYSDKIDKTQFEVKDEYIFYYENGLMKSNWKEYPNRIIKLFL